MSDLKCTNCGMVASYADANIADIRRTCGVEATPRTANERGGYGGDKHDWEPMTSNDEPTDDDRTEIDQADVSLFRDETPIGSYLMVVPTDDGVGVDDLGDLVADRIEANGKVTFPDDVDLDGFERTPLGTVYWDENGIPTRLVRDDDVVVHFTDTGGVDRVEGDGGSA